MTRERTLIILGAIVLLSPWSGLPLAWLTWILLGIGVVVMVIGFTLMRRSKTTLPPSEPSLHLEPESRCSHIAFS
jgi:hypothetical protein